VWEKHLNLTQPLQKTIYIKGTVKVVNHLGKGGSKNNPGVTSVRGWGAALRPNGKIVQDASDKNEEKDSSSRDPWNFWGGGGKKRLNAPRR